MVPAGVRSLMASATDRVAGRLLRKDAYRKVAALWRDPDALPHPYFYTRLLFTPSQVSQLRSSDDRALSAPWYEWLRHSAEVSEQLDDFTAVSCLESRSYMVSTLLR